MFPTKAASVKKQVMAVVDQKIKTGQERYEADAADIDEKCDEEVKTIETRREEKKNEAMTKVVDSILTK
jgi:hypothetical protein